MFREGLPSPESQVAVGSPRTGRAEPQSQSHTEPQSQSHRAAFLRDTGSEGGTSRLWALSNRPGVVEDEHHRRSHGHAGYRTGLDVKCNSILCSLAVTTYCFLTWTKPLGSSHDDLASESKEKGKSRVFPYKHLKYLCSQHQRRPWEVSFIDTQTLVVYLSGWLAVSIMLFLLNLHTHNFHLNIAFFAYRCTLKAIYILSYIELILSSEL